jgi:hypothetical protein
MDDEAMANRMQEQYRLEFLQRQARKNSRARATAPVATTTEEMEIDLSNNPYPVASSRPPPSTMDEDEALARRLQEEMDRDEEMAYPPANANNNNTFGSSSAFFRSSSTTTTTSTPLDEDARMAQMLQDEEMARRYSRHIGMQEVQQSTFLDERSDDDDDTKQARRIAQELHDAEIAERLSLFEQESASRQQVAAQQQQTRQASRNHRVYGRFLPLLCCGVILAVVLLFVLGVFNSEDIPFFGDLDPSDWIENDPWGGQGIDGSTPDSNGSFRW